MQQVQREGRVCIITYSGTLTTGASTEGAHIQDIEHLQEREPVPILGSRQRAGRQGDKSDELPLCQLPTI